MNNLNTKEFNGFVDVHVHFRDPGLPNVETISSGLAAAAHGGISAVVTMPNTTPACDSKEIVNYQKEKAKNSHVLLCPSATLTRAREGNEVSNIEALAESGVAFLTDDGSFVSCDRVMELAMRRAANVNLTICQHAIAPHILGAGVIRDCYLARNFNLPIIPEEAEAVAIRRDLALCRITGCALHIQHISTARGVELVRNAQREGLKVTAEATPHHLLLTCDDLTVDDANFKMAPPLGTHEDRAELRRAVKDGVLMFATDHAPHARETKSKGFLHSANGIIGLETAIPITYQVMVEEEGMPINDWAKAWNEMPLKILSASCVDEFAKRKKTILEIGEKKKVDSSNFASLSKNSPYDDMTFTCWAKEIK